jgi:XapX domain-containing protein
MQHPGEPSQVSHINAVHLLEATVMIKILAGIALGLLIGAGCRYFDIPTPAPPKLIGAILVVAMTVGYAGADKFLSSRPATTAHLSAGPAAPRADR